MVQLQKSALDDRISVVQADTSRERPADRAEYWNEVVRKHVVELECRAESSRELLCQMEGFACPTGAATLISVGKMSVSRLARAVDREASDVVILNLLLHGSMHVSQLGSDCSLSPGDFSICVGDKPYELGIPAAMTVACFRLPMAEIGCSKTVLNRLVARSSIGKGGMAPLLQAYAGALIEQRLAVTQRTSETAMRQLASLLGAVVQQAIQDEPVQRTEHRERLIGMAKYIVNSRVDDEEFSAAAVAAEMKISPRYLQRLWAEDNDSLSEYISETRLKRVAQSMKNPARAAESLTQIAMSHGFVNMSHFARSFRKKHGTTPTAYRESAGLASWDDGRPPRPRHKTPA